MTRNTIPEDTDENVLDQDVTEIVTTADSLDVVDATVGGVAATVVHGVEEAATTEEGDCLDVVEEFSAAATEDDVVEDVDNLSSS